MSLQKINENTFVTGGGYERFTIMKNIAWISNWLKVSIFAAFGVLFSANSLWAQSSGPSLLIGPIVGYNGVTYNTNAFGPPNSLPEFDNIINGIGGAQYAGISVIWPILKMNQNFFVVEALYDSKSASFTSDANYTSFKPGTLSHASLSASLTYLFLNLGYKHNFFRDSVLPTGFGIQLCVSLGKTITSKFTTVVLDTENFSTGSTGPVQNGSSVTNIDGINAFQFDLRFELTYDIPLAQRWILTPSVGYDSHFTKVDSTSRNWWASSAYGAIALRYAIGSF